MAGKHPISAIWTDEFLPALGSSSAGFYPVFCLAGTAAIEPSQLARMAKSIASDSHYFVDYLWPGGYPAGPSF